MMKMTNRYRFKKTKGRAFKETGLIAKETARGEFMALLTPYQAVSKYLAVPSEARDILQLEATDRVHLLPFPSKKT
jgi:hypothetical protein